MPDIAINLAVEDELSEVVARRILEYTQRPYVVCACYRRGGYGYLKDRINSFNEAARIVPFVVLTDLDKAECAPALIREWLSHPRHPNLLLRVAVPEVEAWLLADGPGLAQFLGVAPAIVPSNVESLPDAKNTLIALARRSRRRDLRDSIVPPPGSSRTQGPDYNGALSLFVQQWDIGEAMQHAPSLQRTVSIARSFDPQRLAHP
jgi:hypothetical protein